MAGFQVANFSFGKNIKDDERQRAIAAMNAATARRGQEIQSETARRGQDIQEKESEARLAEQAEARKEGARQFDERIGADNARLAEGARQFDQTQTLKEREYADKRSDIERAQSWDDAIKLQQMEKEDQEFQIRNAELERILAIRQKEDEERAHQQELMESAYGNAVIATELGGGFLTQKQVADFNEHNGTNYNYIGKIDPTTGKSFSDNKIHFIEYAIDGNGKLAIDQNSGRPMLKLDNPISNEFYGRTMDGYFGKYKDRLSGSGMSEERMQLERERLAQRQQEEQGRNARAGSKNDSANARLAASVAKNMNDIKRGLQLNDKQAAAFKTSLTKILVDAFNPQDGSGDEGKPQVVDEPKSGTRKIKGYRYNKDRSKRIPVYDDGTQGEIETVDSGAAE
ncbi:MAG: hypothetical protein ACI4QT_07505 [Kiritimatiellia bacterium]